MKDGFVNWAEVDLDAIAHNVAAFKRHVGDRVEIFAVVKANAYGHGAVPVSRTALKAGATRLAVHRAGEAVELRKGGITAPVLVMGYTPPENAERVLRWNLTPSLMTIEFAQVLSARAVAGGVTVPVHVKVDTGMNRFGLMPEEVIGFMTALRRLPGIFIEGLFTHFSTADSTDLTHVRRQLALFNEVRASLSETGIHIPIAHAANSAALMRLPESHLNAVRPGIAMYGLHPSDQWPPVFEIKPALTLKSIVARVREIPAGEGISYGKTFITTKNTRVALVPIGYGDGYHRVLSNKASVLIRGRRAPILGRICMDQFVVDVTGIPGVKLEDEVVLIGSQGKMSIPAEEVASLAGTINYEVTTSILPRVPRVYRKSGRITRVTKMAEE
jgi:alanine racemase